MSSVDSFPDLAESLFDPLSYLQPSDQFKTSCLNGVKRMFDFYKSQSQRLSLEVSTGPLEELYIEGFDNEQIWAEIELLNDQVLKSLKKQVKKVVKRESETTMKGNDRHGPSDPAVLPGATDFMEEDGDKDGVLSEEDSEKEGGGGKERGRRSVVDDQFFKLAEMEKFLEMAEREEELDSNDGSISDDEDIDYFTGHLTDSADRPQYADFFDSPKPVGSRGGDPSEGGDASDSGEDSDGGDAGDLGEDSDDSDLGEGGEDGDAGDLGEGGEDGDTSDLGEDGDDTEDHDQPLSTHEKKLLKMQQRIANLEAVNLAPKAWQLAGETSAKGRPLNSLLAEDLSFDHMSRPAPVVTEETTKTLEDLIKQRIIDEAWDDVERKVKPAEKPYDYSRSRPLEQEKSKLSLAEVYEQEYLKQTQAEEETKEDERHTEIKELMKKLFVKLDALSNYHFTPKPPKPDVKIVANVPAIQMEEVAPVAISDTSRLAPEEIHAKSKRLEIGATEKSDTDRKRDRRLKKKQKRFQVAEKKQREKVVAKLRPGLGNKFTRKAMEQKLKEREQDELVDKSLKSSSKFFAKLQEQVKEQVKSVKQTEGGRKKRTASAQQYKL